MALLAALLVAALAWVRCAPAARAHASDGDARRLYRERFGVCVEDTVRVSDTGPQELTHFPKRRAAA